MDLNWSANTHNARTNTHNLQHQRPLLSPHARAGAFPATAVALLVRVGYFVSLLGSFVFTLHPLRHCVLEVALGSNFPTKKQERVRTVEWTTKRT